VAARRTSRRLRPNERKFVEEISPLDYTPTGYPKGSVRRLALIDTEAPEAPKNARYFVEYTREQKIGKGGRFLKKPRKIVEPGATPNTLSFIDYHVYGNGKYVYINYMRTRDDVEGKGLARALLLHFMDDAERSGVTHVNFGKIMSPAIGKLYQEYERLYEGGASKLKVSGSQYW
jgi:predicted GNAT family acetyltransferase